MLDDCMTNQLRKGHARAKLYPTQPIAEDADDSGKLRFFRCIHQLESGYNPQRTGLCHDFQFRALSFYFSEAPSSLCSGRLKAERTRESAANRMESRALSLAANWSVMSSHLKNVVTPNPLRVGAMFFMASRIAAAAAGAGSSLVFANTE